MPPPALPLGRRGFLRLAAGGGLLPAVALCACAAARTVTATARDGRLRLTAAELTAAFGDGDVILVRADGLPEDLYLVRAGGRVTDAVGATCTHLGCQVRPARGFFRCPCHGSTYRLDGTVVRGPAPKPLTRYRLAMGEGYVEIEKP